MANRVRQARISPRAVWPGVVGVLLVAGLVVAGIRTRAASGRDRDDGTWIREGVLARGYPRAEREIAALRAQGIRVIVNLDRRPHDPRSLARYGLREIHLPVRDFTAPSRRVLEEGVAAIEAARRNGSGVCVHCSAGKGRTGTLLACWLVRREGIDAGDAIREMRRLRPDSVETRGQRRAIEAFARACPGDSR